VLDLLPEVIGKTRSRRLYPPLAPQAVLLYFVLVIILTLFFPLIAVAAFKSAGIPGWTGLMILWLSLIGSFINIPIKEVKTGRIVRSWGIIYFFGIPYYVPKVSEEKMIIALNVGGALIPLAVSAYMYTGIVIHGGIDLAIRTLASLIIVSIVSYKASRVIEGVGIAIPAFIPSITAVIASLLLCWPNPASSAYISGSLGTLVGADLMNYKKFRSLNAQIVSIGGAGTFDGIFLSGLLALILVAALK